MVVSPAVMSHICLSLSGALSQDGQPASGSLRDGRIGGEERISVGVIYWILGEGEREEAGERDGEKASRRRVTDCSVARAHYLPLQLQCLTSVLLPSVLHHLSTVL